MKGKSPPSRRFHRRALCILLACSEPCAAVDREAPLLCVGSTEVSSRKPILHFPVIKISLTPSPRLYNNSNDIKGKITPKSHCPRDHYPEVGLDKLLDQV